MEIDFSLIFYSGNNSHFYRHMTTKRCEKFFGDSLLRIPTTHNFFASRLVQGFPVCTVMPIYVFVCLQCMLGPRAWTGRHVD